MLVDQLSGLLGPSGQAGSTRAAALLAGIEAAEPLLTPNPFGALAVRAKPVIESPGQRLCSPPSGSGRSASGSSMLVLVAWMVRHAALGFIRRLGRNFPCSAGRRASSRSRS